MSGWGLDKNRKIVEDLDKPVKDPYKRLLVGHGAEVRGTGATPGETIVKMAKKFHPNEDPVIALFTELVTFGNENGWQWVPKGSGSPEPLLDGVGTGGECAAFAKALLVLATAPSKHGLGLGLSSALFDMPRPYTGQYNKGFISANNKGRNTMIDAGFISNVFTAEGDETDMMLWNDHKVVGYDGMLLDPSYGKYYRAPDSLVLYHIKDRDVTFGGASYCRAISRDGRSTVLFREDGDLERVVGNTPYKVATKWRGPLPNQE